MSNSSRRYATAPRSPTRQRILSEQRSILRRLTQPSEYEDTSPEALPAGLRGLDLDRLRLVARLALDKRMWKIEAVLPATVHCVHHRCPHLIRRFAERFPPTDPTRYVNARQLHDFLIEISGSSEDHPAYLQDLVRCEFAVASVVREAKRIAGPAADPPPVPAAGTVRIRTRPEVALVEFQYCVRPLLENPASPPPVAMPKSPGALAILPAEGSARTLQIDRQVYDLLRSLGDWVPLSVDSNADGPVDEALRELHGQGLVEVRPCVFA